MRERLYDTGEIAVRDLAEFLQETARHAWPLDDAHPQRPPSLRLALGREPIQLGVIEFRILLFLANRPYHAFTRRCIAEAVHTASYPLMEEAVDHHISNLHDQLGPFHDYVQAVPYIGYRFKP
jgi:DNA-binding response OmpR family regulator